MSARHRRTVITITALSALLLAGCSTRSTEATHTITTTTNQAAESSATPEVPPYYNEFDPALMAKTVQPPCANIPDEFFLDLKLNVAERQDMSDSSKTVLMCTLRILHNQGTNMPGNPSFIFSWDQLTEAEVSKRFEIFRREGPWLISNEERIFENSTCTVSISTKRGRLGVTRTQSNRDAKKQQSFCYEALEVIKKTANYLHYDAKII